MSIGMWSSASTRRKRLLSIVAVFIVAVVVTVLGTFVPMSAQEARQASNDFNQTFTTVRDQGVLVQFIFGQNLLICLLMFVPIIGPVLGLLIMFDTGTLTAAIATSQGIPAVLALAITFIPIGFIEFTAYSTAMAESVWLFRRLLQGRVLRELRNVAVFVGICSVTLALSALLETALISIGY